MDEEKAKKINSKKKYRSFDLDALEERKLLILAAHKGYTSTRAFIRILISEALQKAENEGLFVSLDKEPKS